MNETAAMRRALALAWKGWGRVQPNPLVGAVLLAHGKKIAEGYHAEFGGPHAEIVALEQAGRAKGATLVVTLEPCNHHGKTPPCTEALIAAGITRVVFAARDPSDAARGGARRLAEGGIEVEGGLMATEAAAQNALFLGTETRTDRPFVALKVATSLDGFVADEQGNSQWISGKEARDWVQWLRAGFGALAVGRRTAERDDPLLTVRGQVEPRVPPSRVVISRGGRIAPHLRLVKTAREIPTILLATGRDLPAARSLAGIQLMPADGLLAAVRSLRERGGIRTMLVEGGGEVAGALLESGLVDRIYWVQSPILLGKGTAAFGDRPGQLLEVAARWTVTERRALGADTLLVVDREPCSPVS